MNEFVPWIKLKNKFTKASSKLAFRSSKDCSYVRVRVRKTHTACVCVCVYALSLILLPPSSSSPPPPSPTTAPPPPLFCPDAQGRMRVACQLKQPSENIITSTSRLSSPRVSHNLLVFIVVCVCVCVCELLNISFPFLLTRIYICVCKCVFL